MRSPLLNDDCDWELLGCSAAELSPINAVDIVEPSIILWLCNEERPALLSHGQSLAKLTWPGREDDEPVEPRNPRKKKQAYFSPPKCLVKNATPH